MNLNQLLILLMVSRNLLRYHAQNDFMGIYPMRSLIYTFKKREQLLTPQPFLCYTTSHQPLQREKRIFPFRVGNFHLSKGAQIRNCSQHHNSLNNCA